MRTKVLGTALILVALVACFEYGRIRGKRGSAVHTPLYYVDPMHPAYRSSKPGIAPDCGMELVPVYAEDLASGSATGSSADGSVRIGAGIQQQYGIRLAKAMRGSSQEEIRVFGRVMPDETRIFRVNLGTEGYVKETHGDAVGELVKKDQRLATIYSPDFLAVIGGYLSANERSQTVNGLDSAQNSASASARADRLRNLGMSDSQIREITETRKIPEDVYVVSPVDGFVLTRTISAGLRFERQNDLYTIADLSHVLVVAEVFGADTLAFQPGAAVTVSIPDTNQRFPARVTNVLPDVDPVAGATKVRIEVNNPGFKLRPNLAVDVVGHTALRAGLTIPADAVLDSGKSQRVFVKTAEGTFAPRIVQTGEHYADRVQILGGLKEGDLVVSDGAFLVDSESRLTASVSIDSDGQGSLSPSPSADAASGRKP